MRLFRFLFLIPMIKALVIVKIHRHTSYNPRSLCAYIGNTSLVNDASIQSCIWECTHQQRCQTAVYYQNERICSMFDEYCEIGQIKSVGNDQSSVICYRKNPNPIITCPLSTTINQDNKEETTTSLTMISTDSPNLTALTDTNETVFGIWNTTASGNSVPATSGNSEGNYVFSESPHCAFDWNVSTKYLSFGLYPENVSSIDNGINTGFYITPNRCPSLLRAVQFRAANDFEDRDPWTMTLEGSNLTSVALTVGSSWSLIYSGVTGLDNSTQRFAQGAMISFPNNSIWYSSYRVLITSKRGMSNSVQYSEVEFFI